MLNDIKKKGLRSIVCLTLVLSLGSGIAQASEDPHRDYLLESMMILLTSSSIVWTNIQNTFFPSGTQFSDPRTMLDLMDTEHLGDVVDHLTRETSLQDAPIHQSVLQFQDSQILLENTSIDLDTMANLFSQEAERQHWHLGRGSSYQIRMIIAHLMQSNSAIHFDSLDKACQEIYFRLFMISQYANLASHTRYNPNPYENYYNFNFFSDARRKYRNTNWCSVPCTYRNMIFENVAFAPSQSVTPFQAVSSLYTQHQELDCGAYTLALVFGSLAMTLGEEGFNSVGSSFVRIAPYHVNFEGEDHPIFELGILEDVEVESLDELLPGDIVYFQNLPNYALLDPTGYWSGEYCVYLGTYEGGEQLFVGLGVEHGSYDGIVEAISSAYVQAYNSNQQKRRNPKFIEVVPDQTEEKLEGSEEVIGGIYPGLLKTIFSIGGFRSGGFFSKENPE